MIKRTALAALAAIAVSEPAHATVTISTGATQNMVCTAEVCSPTAADAVLNVSDLESMLASGSATVTTTGSGVQADDIALAAALSWSSGSTLGLDAFHSIMINKSISIQGQAGFLLTTNDGGTGGVVSIGRKGNVDFESLSSQLTIDGSAYTLVGTIASLATAIASNPSGLYAFAAPYDASADGTYRASPIQTDFTGTLEGLGNAVSTLSIQNSSSELNVGLFDTILGGTVAHFRLVKADIVGAKDGEDCIGALAGANNGGLLFQDSAKGKIRGRGKYSGIGGLVCLNGSPPGAFGIEESSADVTIEGDEVHRGEAGGLVGINEGGILESFSAGPILIGSADSAGGTVGINANSLIEDSYSTSAITGGNRSQVGGLVGQEDACVGCTEAVKTSYSTGSVAGGTSSKAGGFVGTSTRQSSYTDDYWDVTTSGTGRASGKGYSRGITGETTVELQSGLPAGFDPSIWAENPKINSGLPYLINNPPPK